MSDERREKIRVSRMGKKPDGRPADGSYMMKGHRYLTGQWGHPLADRHGQVAEHRKVLYDAIGPGPHPCHWCGTSRDWGGLNGINVDHLDSDKLNNDVINLAVSCCGCNRVGIRRLSRREG